MERETTTTTTSSSSASPFHPSSRSSFRLRSPSLNTLRLRRVFDLFDQDADGQITIPELSLALDRLGLGADPSDLASTISSFIRPDRDGLEFEDFEALHRELGDSLFGSSVSGCTSTASLEQVGDEEGEGEGDSDMEEAFKVFDEDGDGYISAKELYTVLGKLGLGEGLTFARVHDMIHTVDRNHDGRVDFGEFKDMMKGISVLGEIGRAHV